MYAVKYGHNSSIPKSTFLFLGALPTQEGPCQLCLSTLVQCCTLLNSNWPSYKEKTIFGFNPRYYVKRNSSYICLLRPRRILLCTAILQKTNSLAHIGLCKNELQYKYNLVKKSLVICLLIPESTLLLCALAMQYTTKLNHVNRKLWLFVDIRHTLLSALPALHTTTKQNKYSFFQPDSAFIKKSVCFFSIFLLTFSWCNSNAANKTLAIKKKSLFQI